MKNIRKTTGSTNNTTKGIGIGILISIFTAFLLSILLTVLVENETIRPESVPVVAAAVHAISVFFGAMVATTIEKGRIAVIAGISGAGYFILLLCINMLVFSSGFNYILSCAAGVLCGVLITILIKAKFAGKKKHRIKIPSR